MQAARRIWLDGANHLQRITRFPCDGGRVHLGYQIPRPDIAIIPDRKAEKILNEKDLCAIATMLMAYQQLGEHALRIERERLSVFCAAGNTQLSDLAPYFSPVKECVDPIAGMFDSRVFGKRLLDLVNPMVVMRTLLNNALCFGSKFIDARGPNSNYFDFENSGIRALYEAYHALLEGRTDCAIVSGVAPVLEPFALNELAEDGYCLSGEACAKPYDSSSEGFNPAEGAVSFALQRYDDAVKQGDSILAVIDSVVLGSDAGFPVFNLDNATSSLLDCWREAADRAELAVEQIGVCIGSGNGHARVDLPELRALQKFQGAHPRGLPMTAIKSGLGETFESSNLMAVAAAIDMFALDQVFPNWRLSQPHDAYSKLRLPRSSEPLNQPTALISSRGLFGSNGAMVVRSPKTMQL
jgi:3-oxoacyl-(acyl-carrier-protein) synthase